MARADIYSSFGDLVSSEIEGRDFSVTAARGAREDILILAPHGGKIEPGTSELARAIAAPDFSLYLFEGLKPSRNHELLHVTSTNFDEPRALAMIGVASHAVAIHGLADVTDEIQVGGLDTALRDQVDTALRSAGFSSRVVTTGHLAARDPANICNRAKSGGVQLEIGRALRDKVRGDEAVLVAVATPIRNVLSRIAPLQTGRGASS